MATISKFNNQKMPSAARIDMNKEERTVLINSIRDAITASGKKFEEIGKDSFYQFFEKQKVQPKMWDSIYSELSSLYKSNSKLMSGSVSMDDTMSKIMDQPPVDYYSSSQNDVKQRTPRKNIFGSISKIG